MMRGKIFTVVNPVSNNGKTARIWPRYENFFISRGIQLDRKYTRKPLHAVELSRRAARDGYQQIMAVGGDGTVNEVVNGLIENDRLINKDISLIVFAQGTGSDYIKTLSIGNKLDNIYNMIKRGKEKVVDLGRLTFYDREKTKYRYFVNVADIGIGGATARLVNNSSKIMGGFLSYLSGVLRTIFSYQNKHLKIKIDGEFLYDEVLNSVMIANGKFFGGGIQIAPTADPTSGKFRIVVLKDLSRMEIVLNLIKAYRGTHLSHPKVESLEGEEVWVEGDRSLVMELDGEITGQLPAGFKILKNKLPVVVG